jgi:Trk-type K+ transport system membrane component
MTITANLLTRWAGIAAAAAGAIFIGVQINHPQLNAITIQTNEMTIRDTFKVLMAALALAGITGMYLNQIRKHGLLGFIGYVVFAVGYLGIMCVAFTAAYVLPEVATTSTGFVNDAIYANTARGTVKGDIGTFGPVLKVLGFAYLVGSLLFGIALYRARVLPQWAAALLAVAGLATAGLALTPDSVYRLLAFPNGVAMIALGYSLWKVARNDAATQPQAIDDTPAPSTASVA